MSYAAKTILAFGVYMLLQGTILLVVPNALLNIVQIPETTEIWVRTTGIAVIVLGFYYVNAARAELKSFFQWTVYMRTFQLIAFIALVALGMGKPILLAFAGTEFLSGVWTQIALRSEGK